MYSIASVAESPELRGNPRPDALNATACKYARVHKTGIYTNPIVGPISTGFHSIRTCYLQLHVVCKALTCEQAWPNTSCLGRHPFANNVFGVHVAATACTYVWDMWGNARARISTGTSRYIRR